MKKLKPTCIAWILVIVLPCTAEDVKVVAEAHHGEEALSIIPKAKPDVVLLDVQLPKRNGIEVLKTLKESNHLPPTLILTTFGDRQEHDLTSYFNEALAAFKSIARISNKNTLIVQMLAFSEPEWQLRRYGAMMKQAGFTELKFPELANGADGRVWRHVPNRKWYASRLGSTHSSNEVVLFHKLS